MELKTIILLVAVILIFCTIIFYVLYKWIRNVQRVLALATMKVVLKRVSKVYQDYVDENPMTYQESQVDSMLRNLETGVREYGEKKYVTSRHTLYCIALNFFEKEIEEINLEISKESKFIAQSIKIKGGDENGII